MISSQIRVLISTTGLSPWAGISSLTAASGAIYSHTAVAALELVLSGLRTLSHTDNSQFDNYLLIIKIQHSPFFEVVLFFYISVPGHRELETGL